MSRALRIKIPNSWHHVHVKTRCNEVVFCKIEQCQLILNLLEEASKRFPVNMIAWNILPSEYHLIIQSLDGDLSIVMKYINGVLSRRINKQNGWNGSFMRGRFRNTIIEKRYVEAAINNIHSIHDENKWPNLEDNKIYASSEGYYTNNCSPPDWMKKFYKNIKSKNYLL